ncbi:Imm5 family immunity protein [Pseudomonas sp. p50(2008)]|uniref:Imm5 family immunity protein n=1 Tax=Pseudomonas sp. p50(2008) TaxID=2816832 RepID=UPI001EEA0A0B|nr:Imm5 family immunity protein [Pseudomonas sp. p50(2008)]
MSVMPNKMFINKLLNQVAQSPLGDFALPSRKLLWNAIAEGEPESTKRLLRTKLDILCVKHASFIWSKKFKDIQGISKMLSIALAAANGTIAKAQALNKRDEFYVEVVEDQDYEAEEYPTMFVGHAAANTIATATTDFTYDPSDLRGDRDLDPEAFEPSYLIASAFAGGLDENGNSDSRREFWEWYLTCAIREVV